jgi:hypothetical protein
VRLFGAVVTERRFARAIDVAWRLAPDRVLLRRPAGGDAGAVDLFGDAALLWTALDTAGSLRTLEQRLLDAGIDRAADTGLSDTVDLLLAEGWLVEVAL